MEVHESDLMKIRDTLESARRFHVHRDKMNAAAHLAGENVRLSPLASSLESSVERVDQLLTETDNGNH